MEPNIDDNQYSGTALYSVVKTNPKSSMGPKPMIWAAEIYPHLFEVDLSGDKLVVGKPYIP